MADARGEVAVVALRAVRRRRPSFAAGTAILLTPLGRGLSLATRGSEIADIGPMLEAVRLDKSVVNGYVCQVPDWLARCAACHAQYSPAVDFRGPEIMAT